MVGFSAVGFAFAVIVVLEFYSACWAVCDAHGLCSGEYLFSELSVFSAACSAHRVSLFCVCVVCVVCCVRWWRVAASARRAPPPSHTTLSCCLFLFLFLFWNGGCCVVRAQPCEHARNTTVALACSGFVYLGDVCCFCHYTVFVVPTTHCS